MTESVDRAVCANDTTINLNDGLCLQIVSVIG